MYPFVDCDRHGDGQLGYAMCVHIVDRNASVAHLVEPTTSEIGEALCRACIGRDHDVSDLRLICAGCADGIFASQAPTRL